MYNTYYIYKSIKVYISISNIYNHINVWKAKKKTIR